jgi:hypothetical protein
VLGKAATHMLWFWGAVAQILAALTVSRFTWLAILAARKRWDEVYRQQRPLWLLMSLLAAVMLGRLWLLDMPLLAAARRGDPVTAHRLLLLGADPNFKKDATALHYAVEGGHGEVVALLMARGANQHRQGEIGHRWYRYTCTPYELARDQWRIEGRADLLRLVSAVPLPGD